jgi:hypothetical protein
VREARDLDQIVGLIHLTAEGEHDVRSDIRMVDDPAEGSLELRDVGRAVVGAAASLRG